MDDVCNVCKYVEKCGKEAWLADKVDCKIKYIDKNGVICVIMRDYHYYFLYREDSDKINKCQITQEEFKRVDEWTNDIDEINRKKIRKLGCCKCNEAAHNYLKRDCLIKKGVSMLKQAELYMCKECGTYWEYGVYKYLVVDDSYVEKYY